MASFRSLSEDTAKYLFQRILENLKTEKVEASIPASKELSSTKNFLTACGTCRSYGFK